MRLLERLRGVLSSLKFRIALTGALLIAISVGCTVFFVFRSLEQRSERAILDSEVSDRLHLVIAASPLVTATTDEGRYAG